MKFRTLLPILAVAVMGCAALPVSQTTPSLSTADYDIQAKRAMAAYDNTGMVVFVMVGDQTPYVTAFGIAEEGKDRTVTPDTLFPIASISKAFTTTALAILVDRGVVDRGATVRTLSLNLPCMTLRSAKILRCVMR